MKTVLIVEDTHAERQMSSALLTHAGFDVAVAEDAESAWKWLNNHPAPNLILLDIVMPGESGLDLCRKIREHSDWQNIPILFCSSKAEEFDRFWAIRQGGNEYITKPYVPQNLVDKVTQFVS
ncbi:MAG TPA: response regulator [Coleofasciculaceae cyanobacterium]|jgi:twitching motility two-component system response regulator PilH